MPVSVETRQFYIKVLGRTLEHLGVQMYKQRAPAITELVANCWDAGAPNVWIDIPSEEEYDRDESIITIRDDGLGMNPEQVQNEYLVVGRNRRRSGDELIDGRRVLGRKGIGKLAGFGVARIIKIITWQGDWVTEFSLDIENLKREDNQAEDVPIDGTVSGLSGDYGPNGTIVKLEGLKHQTPLGIAKLHEFLARRFSRTIRGEMNIYINGEPLRELSFNLDYRCPETGYITERLGENVEVRYYYGFSAPVIRSKEMRGFTIYVRGKTAQAPPFFFDVEGTASGQHSTRYVTGEIEADFIDEGTDDENDVIATDRQEIEWESEQAKILKEWGEELSRKVLRECADLKGKKVENWILEDPAFKERIEVLEKPSQSQIKGFLKTLGRANPDREDAGKLADSLIKVYEFRNFHNVIEDLEKVADDPEKLHDLLTKLGEWKVLESRAILEIIAGRLEIINKLEKLVMNDAPETAKTQGDDNLHDLLGGYPWIINPEWQVLSEEKSLSRQLKEWMCEEIKDEDAQKRYDFLALTGGGKLVVIEIKRASHAVELDELQRLETYRERLGKGRKEEIEMLLIYGGNLNINKQTEEAWKKRTDANLLTWGQICDRSKQYYEHYKAVLEGNVKDGGFKKKEIEVAQTRRVLETGTVWRGKEERKKGLGPQDIELTK